MILTMNLVAAWALNATDWADHLKLVPLVVFFSVVAGSALAASVFPAWLSSIFSTVYGLFVIGRQLGVTLQSITVWRDRIVALLGRVGVLMRVIVRGETNEDPLMFVLLMAVLFWMLGFISVWSVYRRGNAWGAIVPVGTTLAIFNVYYFGSARLGVFLGIFLLVSLFLAVWMDLESRNGVWRRERARVPTDTAYRTILVGFAVAVALVGLAWGAPAFARSEFAAETWDKLTSPLDSVKDRVGDTLGNVRGPVPVMPSEYSDILALEGGEQPVNRFVMEVDPVQFPTGGGRFYWRSRVYEQYDGEQWTVPEPVFEAFDPDSPVVRAPDLEGRQLVDVNIAPMSAAVRQLYAPSQPFWTDRQTQIAVTKSGEEIVDVLALRVEDYIYEGETYRIESSLASPSEYQLRLAGQDYPDWVIENYMQVPEVITERTVQLAQEIVFGEQTPYDQALAITGWLRKNIEYSRETEAPPLDTEPIDWFLFDYQIGFCNYYASAEVIMLRSLGIPARLAAGYARGTYNPAEGVYKVFGEDSHSWPEVYFPDLGWVEFEPTVSQPELVRPEGGLEEERFGGSISASEGNGGPDPDELVEDVEEIELGSGQRFAFSLLNPVFRRILTLGTTVLLAVAAWVRLNPVTWQRARRVLVTGLDRVGLRNSNAEDPTSYAWDSPVGDIYRRFTAWLERLDLLEGQTQTASERGSAFAVVLPDSAGEAWTIVRAYESERFGGLAVERDAVRKAWSRLRGRLWFAWLWKLTERWRRE